MATQAAAPRCTDTPRITPEVQVGTQWFPVGYHQNVITVIGAEGPVWDRKAIWVNQTTGEVGRTRMKALREKFVLVHQQPIDPARLPKPTIR